MGCSLFYITPGRMIDRDRDGLLSVSELRVFLTRLGDRMTEEEVGDMVRLLQPDTRGRVTCEGRPSGHIILKTKEGVLQISVEF